ncbi:hypothetical protein CBER1_01442 [Cercospora berteroae]|uniref:F-box domain-containing protein n=1 Tax=Cercospora berteroae TaxID=357750 RepID=A0A2S6CCB5_9PEZI|nr:hypothetical protein CBER1_01442 [Cercospora berteroae]
MAIKKWFKKRFKSLRRTPLPNSEAPDNTSIIPGFDRPFTETPAVFTIAELLEQVQIGLELGDLLRLRHVCEKWNDSFKKSITLRYHRFLKPKQGSEWLLPPVLPRAHQMEMVAQEPGQGQKA